MPLCSTLSLHSSNVGGIGLETAKQFLQAKVEGLLLVDLSLEILGTAFETLTAEEKGRCEIFVADVSAESQRTYAEKAVELWGRLDIAVLNAGICLPSASILDTTVAAWDRIMNVNARGGEHQHQLYKCDSPVLYWCTILPVFLGLKHCAKAMIDTQLLGGSIVLVSSQLGLEGNYTYVLLYFVWITAVRSNVFL